MNSGNMPRKTADVMTWIACCTTASRYSEFRPARQSLPDESLQRGNPTNTRFVTLTTTFRTFSYTSKALHSTSALSSECVNTIAQGKLIIETRFDLINHIWHHNPNILRQLLSHHREMIIIFPHVIVIYILHLQIICSRLEERKCVFRSIKVLFE